MRLEDIVLLDDKDNYFIWKKINSSNPLELINISMGIDEESVAMNIDEFVRRFNLNGFIEEKSLSEILLKDDFKKKDIIINSFRKYRFIVFDDFKENYERFKGKQEYFTMGALIDDVKTSKLEFRLCILIDYIYETDNYALAAVMGFDGIYLSRVTKELIDLYESSVFPCLKLWELIISGNKNIDNFLEERKFLSEKIPYSYSEKGEISSYSVSIEELYKIMNNKDEGK